LLVNEKCTSCHTEHKGINPDKALVNFSHESLAETLINKCNGCHNSPSDTLHSQLSTTCKNCHSVTGWKSSASFNHDLIQTAVKNNCTSCHQKPNDSYHQLVKDNCDECHSTGKWVPSTFDHSSYFPLDQNHSTTCNTCHISNNFSTYNCYGCHEHSQNKIMEEHSEHGISNFSKCVSCHKSGNKHDLDLNEKNKNEPTNIKEYIENQKRKEKQKHPEKQGGDDD